MDYRLLRRVAALALASVTGPVLAGAVTLSGNLGDTSNAALVASDLGAAQFDDEFATANNVALHALHVVVAGNVRFRSTGYESGGIDPYFTLFNGTDRASASFRASNYVNATTNGGDFTLDEVLAAGHYTVAISVYTNLSFAENSGSGFLADGFTFLGGPGYFGDGSYRFAITLPDPNNGTVPEPGGAVLGLTAAWAAVWASRRRPIQPLITNGGR